MVAKYDTACKQLSTEWTPTRLSEWAAQGTKCASGFILP